jgi:hypothetical protein
MNACVHQTIEQVRSSRSIGPTDRYGFACEVSIGNSGETAVLFVPDMDEFYVAISVESFNDGIERVADHPIAAPHASFLEHLPHHVGYVLRHINQPPIISKRHLPHG